MPRPSPSMIVALAALVVAMAGTGAAGTILVGSAGIRDNAVRSVDIRDGDVRSVDLKDGGVHPADLGPAVARRLNLAPDADQVDGRDAASLVRVAFASDDDDAIAGETGTATALTARIVAPTNGFLVMSASSDVRDTTLGNIPQCELTLDGVELPESLRTMRLDAIGGVNEEEDCATEATRQVVAGAHTVTLQGTVLFPSITFDASALSVIFIPFDGTGASP